MNRKKLKKAVTVYSILFLLYVALYLSLACFGGWELSQTGKVRYSFGFAMSDVIRWQPAWAKWEPFRDVFGKDTWRGNPQGFLFAPMISLDRLWFHPDQPLQNVDDLK